ncbi:uncharacterized protein MELLADRAFT_124583 [Melampsora larici-populina 98AG31]|uniref:Secreted protein n=1 Tax=Melampsora larici-populina (strain 98AG31 / pathotype 3-4-7) TaxID=747676 RepID=F4REG0_MELLP|nr:uncharacterized protein MELLADRAFT_124583 [Melampsora larici-populina 98AG31]EGG09276.1 secreted protein [Melampsora larici-populina 98AG31]
MNRSIKFCAIRFLLFLAWFGIATCVRTFTPTYVELLNGETDWSDNSKLKIVWDTYHDYPQFQYIGRSSLMTCDISILNKDGEYEHLLVASRKDHYDTLNPINVQERHLRMKSMKEYVKLKLVWTDHTELPASSSR